MNARVYNLAMLLGVALVACGVGMEYGVGRGLWIGGALVLAATVAGAMLGGVRPEAVKEAGDVRH